MACVLIDCVLLSIHVLWSFEEGLDVVGLDASSVRELMVALDHGVCTLGGGPHVEFVGDCAASF